MSYMDPMGDIIWTCFSRNRSIDLLTLVDLPLDLFIQLMAGCIILSVNVRSIWLLLSRFHEGIRGYFFLESPQCVEQIPRLNRESMDTMEFVVWLSWANPRVGWVSMMIGDVKEPMVGNDGDGKTRHPLDEIHPRRDQNSLRPNRQS